MDIVFVQFLTCLHLLWSFAIGLQQHRDQIFKHRHRDECNKDSHGAQGRVEANNLHSFATARVVPGL